MGTIMLLRCGSDDEEGRSARYPARRAELDQSCQRGHDRGRQPGGTFVGETIYAGLAPEDILVYVERGEGRRNRPPSKASTVAPIVTAFGKATQSGEGSRRLRGEPFAPNVSAI